MHYFDVSKLKKNVKLKICSVFSKLVKNFFLILKIRELRIVKL